MAALDISNSSNEPSQVMCVLDQRNYLLCTLNKSSQVFQCALDLNFEEGSTVSFATNGKAHVHLTGYLLGDEDGLADLDEEEEETEETVIKQLKRSKKAVEGPPQKKSKKEQKLDALQADLAEEEESDDSDFDIDNIIQDGDSGEEEEEEDVSDEELEAEVGEEEEASTENIEDEEVSSLSDEDIEEEEEEVKPKKNKAKQNGVAKKTPVKEEQKPAQQKQKKKEQKQTHPKKVLKGGVSIEDIVEGTGNLVTPGKFVHVYYEGRLKDSNKMFDSSTKGSGFGFRLGKGEVIKGWDTGIVGMKVGGKRRIICPPGAAYGVKGSPPVIPGNATLVFDVEVKKVV